MDASTYIVDIINRRSSGSVFFSATLEPLDYYVQLITKRQGKSIRIPSPFKQSNLGLYMDVSTSTRYNDRHKSIDAIIDTIYAMAETKHGNYIVFFPSYHYMNMVLEQFNDQDYEVFIQERNMTQNERTKLLDAFSEKTDHTKLGFFVLGGPLVKELITLVIC